MTCTASLVPPKQCRIKVRHWLLSWRVGFRTIRFDRCAIAIAARRTRELGTRPKTRAEEILEVWTARRISFARKTLCEIKSSPQEQFTAMRATAVSTRNAHGKISGTRGGWKSKKIKNSSYGRLRFSGRNRFWRRSLRRHCAIVERPTAATGSDTRRWWQRGRTWLLRRQSTPFPKIPLTAISQELGTRTGARYSFVLQRQLLSRTRGDSDRTKVVRIFGN